MREKHIYTAKLAAADPGPTPPTAITKRRYDIEWTLDHAAIAYDQRSDGTYPLMTNDRTLSPAQVLITHKGQPRIEKRIEALFTVYFLALLTQALIERELRLAMKRAKLDTLPL